MCLGVRFENGAWVGHLINGSWKIGVDAKPNRRVDGGAKPRSLIYMRARDRHAEDIGGDLHGMAALAAAAGHPHLGDLNAGAFVGAFQAFIQRISRAVEDGAVEMTAGMNVTEPDYRAASFRSGQLQPWRPVRLQHQAVRTRRHALDQLVEQRFRLDAQLISLLLLVNAEFAFKPAHHPIAAVNLNLEGVGARYG